MFISKIKTYALKIFKLKKKTRENFKLLQTHALKNPQTNEFNLTARIYRYLHKVLIKKVKLFLRVFDVRTDLVNFYDFGYLEMQLYKIGAGSLNTFWKLTNKLWKFESFTLTIQFQRSLSNILYEKKIYRVFSSLLVDFNVHFTTSRPSYLMKWINQDE